MKKISWWLVVLLCALSAAITAVVMLKILNPPKAQAGTGTYTSYAYDVPYQGAYSETSAIHLTLTDTGVYYLLAWDWTEVERGQYSVDENGVAKLTVDAIYRAGDVESAGFLVPTAGKQFMLLTRDGKRKLKNPPPYKPKKKKSGGIMSQLMGAGGQMPQQ